MKSIIKLTEVLEEIKKLFIGKNEIIDLLGIGLIARENVFLLGPPGTAKSAIVKALSNRIEGGNNFEYLLTRFTEPNEIFGPFDIRKLREGELVTNTEGMLPEASLVFLDEIFNANSAILNSLLMALNEKIYRRGKDTKKMPALMFVAASNLLSEDEALNALLDRFLVRVKCDYVSPDLLHQVLLSGRKIESNSMTDTTKISIDEILVLQELSRNIDLSDISQPYIDIIHSLRNTGIKLSDRRVVKLQNLIAASAVFCGRDKAILSDLWVLKYIWDTEEQIEILESVVHQVISKSETMTQSHPQAFENKIPDAEEIMKEMKYLKERWDVDSISFEEQNIIKDKLRFLQTRCDWVKNPDKKQFLQDEVETFWERILKTV